jgi:hypothetical protein
VSDDQLAAIISFGFPAFIGLIFILGNWMGRRTARTAFNRWLAKERADRTKRWSSPQSLTVGEPGTPERLLSDYEDAIYTAARQVAFAAYEEVDESHMVSVATQLYSDVRNLRAKVLAELTAATDH